MRIGIDIDDTICNTWEYIKPYFKSNFNIDDNILNENNYSRTLNCSKEEYYSFFKEKKDNIIHKITKKKDDNKKINKLKDEGHKIYLITARGNLDMKTPYETTKLYLQNNNIKYDKLCLNSLEKDIICHENKIDIFIDDSIKHCTIVSKLGIPVLLMDASYNKQCDKFRRVNTWEEIYNIIKE